MNTSVLNPAVQALLQGSAEDQTIQNLASAIGTAKVENKRKAAAKERQAIERLQAQIANATTLAQNARADLLQDIHQQLADGTEAHLVRAFVYLPDFQVTDAADRKVLEATFRDELSRPLQGMLCCNKKNDVGSPLHGHLVVIISTLA